MANDDVGLIMFQELIENHRDDYEGAVVKIEEWRGLINILEKFVEIAKEHPDGWDHVLGMMEARFSGEGEEEEQG
jgi:hypothetical protein